MPSAEESRAMLLELQAEGLADRALAAAIGANCATVDSWIRKARPPSAAARRLIWILHRAIVLGRHEVDPVAWVTWGKSEEVGKKCRFSAKK